jgi:hypothetical protein
VPTKSASHPAIQHPAPTQHVAESHPATETVSRWRIDAAHTTGPATHAIAKAQATQPASWLAQVIERKSLLALGIIALATGIIAICVIAFNQAHQHLPAIRVDAAVSQPSADEANPRFMPATPRASNDTDLRLPPRSAIEKPTAARDAAGDPHQPSSHDRSLLPAAVLGTTLNDSPRSSVNPVANGAIANGSIPSSQLAANSLSAMNSPASIAPSNPTNQNPAGRSANAQNAQTTSVPLMADYHAPERAAAPFENSIGAQGRAGSVAVGANQNPAAGPILEARRQAITGNAASATSGISGGARFDGGITRPNESFPR